MNRTFEQFYKKPGKENTKGSDESFVDGVDLVKETPKAEEKDSEAKLKTTHDVEEDWDELKEGK